MSAALDQTVYQSLLTEFEAQTIANSSAAEKIQFRLFHAPNSVCSQKARIVFFHLQIGFHAHRVNIFEGKNYAPSYVKTRVNGCAGAGLELASRHTGSTSARVTGCDACVVPTLVEADTRTVTVDSVAICVRLDNARGDGVPSLIPEGLKSQIFDEIQLVDELPNYPLLGAAIARKNNYSGAGNPFAASKVARCEKLLLEHKDDADLVAAYTAKMHKEITADRDLFTPEALEVARGKMEDSFKALEHRLSQSIGHGLFGDQLTLADVFWAVELVRSEDLSMGYIWTEGGLDLVAKYYGWLQSLPAVQAAILDWPDARMRI